LTDAEIGLLRKLRTLNGADYEAQYFDTKPTPNKKTLIDKMGNPTPLAVACFGITNTLMSLFLMQLRGVDSLNFLVGTMWFTAGVINLIVGIFELLVGNTFAYTIFGSLGGYFLSMGALLTPAFGISEHYLNAKHISEFRNAMGMFNLCWGAMFFLFLVVAIRSNIFMVLIFACVCTTCVISAVGDFEAAKGHAKAKKDLDRVAGIFLFLSSVPNWYLLFIMLAYSSGWKVKFYTGEIGPNKHAHAQKIE